MKFFLHTALVTVAICLMVSNTSASTIDRPFFRAGPVVVVFSGGDFIENDGEAPLVHDFVLLDGVGSGSEGNDLIATDGVPVNFPFDPISDGTSGGWPFEIINPTSGGQYNNNPSFQMLDENDSYTAFGLDQTTDIDLLGNQVRFAWFFVASNAPFDIFAQASNLQAEGDFTGLDFSNIRYRLLVRTPASSSIGLRSQNPSFGGQGVVIGNGSQLWTLDDLDGAPQKVFDGGRRTARASGTLAQQAAGFASVYNLRGASVNGNNYDLSMGTGVLSADVTYTIYAP